jgi:hypothetical protein
MDHRAEMHAIEVGQRAVTDADPLATTCRRRTSGRDRRRRGTALPLRHARPARARRELRRRLPAHVGKERKDARPLKRWPYASRRAVELFVLAGHRNMEGERAFVQDSEGVPEGARC